MPLRLVAILVAALCLGCSGPAGTTVTSTIAAGEGGDCSIPPHTYADLAACTGISEQIELTIAERYDGKTTAKIAIPSKDADTILAAMGAFTKEWSTGSDSFTVFAYGSREDAAVGGFNRGQIFWNNGGQITVDICTEFAAIGGVDLCADQTTYMVANQWRDLVPMRTTPDPLRDRYNAFIARNEVAWELVTAGLAAAFVAVGFAADDAPEGMRGPLLAIDFALTVILALEFLSRFGAARDRRAYIRGHWIDAVALIPTVRWMRLLRLLRLLRLVRVFSGVYRALVSFERFAAHKNLVGLFLAWIAVAGICATAMYLAEVGVNPNVRSFTDALWWGVVTLTTVGYGDVFPVTPEGRIAGAALMILGITLFAAITGTITSLLIAGRRDAGYDPITRLRELDELHRDGVISQDEYATAKTAVLASITR